MPVKSYIIYLLPGTKKNLINKLESLSECKVIPAENEDILVVVTDTRDNKQEKELESKLNNFPEIQSLALVSGYNDPI